MFTDNDDTPVEKVSLSTDDFSDDLSNPFGIEDTQVLSSQELNSFLLNEDPDSVVSATDKTPAATEKAEGQSAEEEPKGDKKVAPKKKEEKAEIDNSELLNDLLYDKSAKEDDADGADPAGSNEKDEEDTTYATLGKDLLRLGVFSKMSEEESEDSIDIKTPEEFLERFTLEKKKGAIDILDNFLSQFGEDRRKMFDAVFVNGVEPREYLDSFSRVEALQDLDVSDEGNQERILRTYYKSLNWDDDKINKRITKLRDYGDLEEEAAAFHEVLVNKEKETLTEIENKKKEEAQKQKEREQDIQKSYQRILSEKLKSKEIDGIPLTHKDAEEVFSYMVNKPYKTQSGEYLSQFDKDLLELNRPENHELKIKLGLLLKRKLDLTPVKKATITKKSDALFTLTAKNAKKEKSNKQVDSFF